jgi:hypothetical protein
MITADQPDFKQPFSYMNDSGPRTVAQVTFVVEVSEDEYRTANFIVFFTLDGGAWEFVKKKCLK